MSDNLVPILVSWSGGKDSALALYEVIQKSSRPIELFTTINQKNNRVAMHGISEHLLDKQAQSIGLPLHKIYIPAPCSNEEYQQIMNEFMQKMKNRGIKDVVFGDLFLEDIRKYREENLSRIEMNALFPLWDIPTTNVALQFIKKGFKALLSCTDSSVLHSDYSGREYNMDLLGELPLKVDPCGENGEFHTFVYDGPIFSFPIKFSVGEKIICYERFCYTDISEE